MKGRLALSAGALGYRLGKTDFAVVRLAVSRATLLLNKKYNNQWHESFIETVLLSPFKLALKGHAIGLLNGILQPGITRCSGVGVKGHYLTVLELQANRIERLSCDFFQSLPYLEELYLGCNRLVCLPRLQVRVPNTMDRPPTCCVYTFSSRKLLLFTHIGFLPSLPSAPPGPNRKLRQTN